MKPTSPFWTAEESAGKNYTIHKQRIFLLPGRVSTPALMFPTRGFKGITGGMNSARKFRGNRSDSAETFAEPIP